MARIAHLAMDVDDIDKCCEFYSKVFQFTQIKVPGLRSTGRFLSDGNVHIAINQSCSEKEAGKGTLLCSAPVKQSVGTERVSVGCSCLVAQL
jgi:catechol 2,3-dioxygenase-like lactoylglutathione lyase family enzyme